MNNAVAAVGGEGEAIEYISIFTHVTQAPHFNPRAKPPLRCAVPLLTCFLRVVAEVVRSTEL